MLNMNWLWCCCPETPTTGELSIENKTASIGLMGAHLPENCDRQSVPSMGIRDGSGLGKSKYEEDTRISSRPHTEDPLRNGGAAVTANTPDGRSMTAEEKAREKTRLQILVKDFAKEVVTGMPVSVIDIADGSKCDKLFSMDRYLMNFTLAPSPAIVTSADQEEGPSFSMNDIMLIYKAQDVSDRLPSLPSDVTLNSVGIDIKDGKPLIFHFEEAYERDKFYTCIKILRMSVDMAGKK
mmetsp:Transcript_6773/g.16447  ORF Transcript_6773/g.16447 Transcript_6773/m.16447 type:complete len:238 (-) Transcript_6773:169-882(-)